MRVLFLSPLVSLNPKPNSERYIRSMQVQKIFIRSAISSMLFLWAKCRRIHRRHHHHSCVLFLISFISHHQHICSCCAALWSLKHETRCLIAIIFQFRLHWGAYAYACQTLFFFWKCTWIYVQYWSKTAHFDQMEFWHLSILYTTYDIRTKLHQKWFSMHHHWNQFINLLRIF